MAIYWGFIKNFRMRMEVLMVDPSGIEPLTSSLPATRSPS